MKFLSMVTLPLSIGLILSGCGTKDIKISKLHPVYEKKLNGKDINRYYSFFNKNGASDFDIRQTIAAIALEGKKLGFQYFTLGTDLSYLGTGGEFGNFLGSPITKVDEIIEYCDEELFGKQRPNCWSGRNPNVYFSVTYMNELSDNYMVWNIEDTLNDTNIKGSPTEYELFPMEYRCNGQFLKSSEEECILDEDVVHKEVPVFLLPATTKVN